MNKTLIESLAERVVAGFAPGEVHISSLWMSGELSPNQPRGIFDRNNSRVAKLEPFGYDGAVRIVNDSNPKGGRGIKPPFRVFKDANSPKLPEWITLIVADHRERVLRYEEACKRAVAERAERDAKEAEIARQRAESGEACKAFMLGSGLSANGVRLDGWGAEHSDRLGRFGNGFTARAERDENGAFHVRVSLDVPAKDWPRVLEFVRSLQKT